MSTNDIATLDELTDAELDDVSAAGRSLVSIGNIAIGVQVNNAVNVAVLNFGDVVQAASQVNIINSGNFVTWGVSLSS
jgi:archaellum component FlaF (FlaF/FlaG flagellin family)